MADMHGREDAERAAGLQLAERLATRLCHDLAGPLSGLVAALGEAGADAEALPLAVEAADALRQRLALFRAAWGTPGPLSADALRQLCAGLPRAERLRIDLVGPVAATALSPRRARLLLNALLLAAESLPRGGGITLQGDPAGTLALGIDGANAAWPDGLAAMLHDPARAARRLAEGARGALHQAAWLVLLAVEAGARLTPPSGPAAPLSLDLAAAGG